MPSYGRPRVRARVCVFECLHAYSSTYRHHVLEPGLVECRHMGVRVYGRACACLDASMRIARPTDTMFSSLALWYAAMWPCPRVRARVCVFGCLHAYSSTYRHHVLEPGFVVCRHMAVRVYGRACACLDASMRIARPTDTMFSSLALWYAVIWPSECFHAPLASMFGSLLITDQKRRVALGSALRSIRISPIPWKGGRKKDEHTQVREWRERKGGI